VLPFLIHIVDDDPQARAAISYLLANHGFATEIYSGGEEFLRQARLDRGCVLLDMDMPGMGGHAVQRELGRRDIVLPVIATGHSGDLAGAVEAMKLGAVEYLQKPLEEQSLVAAVERAIGEMRRSDERRNAAKAAAVRLQTLSRRERQVLQGLVGGLSNKAIARILELSPRTVEMHRANMMAALRLTSLPDALRLAIDGGLAPLGQVEPKRTERGRGAPPPSPRRQAQGEVGGRDERLRLVLEASSDGAWDWDLRTGQIRLSSGLIDRLGYVPEAVPDRLESYEGLLHPADRGTFRRTLEAHLGGETETYACTYRIRTRSGDWLWTDVRGRVVERDPASGAPLRMIGTANDITRQREDEERARESFALLSLVQTSVGAGIWHLDVETRRLHLCARSRAMHELPEEGDLDLDRWVARVEPEDLPGALEALERAIATGGRYEAEYRVRRPSGGTIWIKGVGQAVTGEGGQHRIVGLNQDVTAVRAGGSAPSR